MATRRIYYHFLMLEFMMIYGKSIFIFNFGQLRIRSARKFESVQSEKGIKSIQGYTSTLGAR